MAVNFSDMLIEKNDIHNNGRRNISLNLVSDQGTAEMSNIIIQDNKLHNGYHTTGVDLAIHGVGQKSKNIIIRRNHIYEPYNVDTEHLSEGISLISRGLRKGIDSVYIYNNIIQNNTLDGVYLEDVMGAIIVNNTFTGPGFSGSGRAFIMSVTPSNITNMNNIFCNYTTGAMMSIKGNIDSTVLDTSDYNIYYTSHNVNSTRIWYNLYGQSHYYYNNGLAPMRTLGFETHSPDIPVSPFFIDSISDLRLRSSFPAIEAGTPVSFVTTDFFGNSRDPLHPDIGAFEYNPDILNAIEKTNYKNDILSLFPNPVSNNLTVKLSDKWFDNYSIQLYNVEGAKVYEHEYSNSNSQTINVAGFPKGIYFIKVVSDNLEIKTKKIILK